MRSVQIVLQQAPPIDNRILIDFKAKERYIFDSDKYLRISPSGSTSDLTHRFLLLELGRKHEDILQTKGWMDLSLL
jgi:hypothetical protein